MKINQKKSQIYQHQWKLLYYLRSQDRSRVRQISERMAKMSGKSTKGPSKHQLNFFFRIFLMNFLLLLDDRVSYEAYIYKNSQRQTHQFD